MPYPPRLHIFAKKVDPEPGLCILVDNGTPCHRSIASRGICSAHRTHLEHAGRLEEFCLPKQSKRYDLRPDPAARAGMCPVLENGIACTAPGRRRGVCDRHYAGIWQRPDLNMDDFARDPVKPTLERKKTVTEAVCALRERLPDGTTVQCHVVAFLRGLCQPHYRQLQRYQPELLRVLADPPRKAAGFRMRKDTRAGVCVVIEDDVGCSRSAMKGRQVCLTHVRALRASGQLPELTATREDAPPALQRRVPAEVVEGECLLAVNGIACRNVPKRRGLCGQCLHQIQIQKLNLEDYARAVVERGHHTGFERRSPLVAGVCLLIEGGALCQKPSVTRGLCRHHYRVLEHAQGLPRFALTDDETARLPKVPHWYFDKNIIIDFARQELFRDPAVPDSVILVAAVLARKVQASVSLDCVRALYTYLGHRLSRALDEGGRGLEPPIAERQAREYAGKLFFGRNGLWHVVPYDVEQVRACAAGGRLPALSLEDALEVQLFAKVKAEHAATLFVTADRFLIEQGHGVHPRSVVPAHAELMERRG